MKKSITTITVAVLALGGLAACGDSSETVAQNIDLPQDAATSAPAEPDTDWANVQAFLDASAEDGGYAGLVAPDSPAERWTEFRADMHRAEVSGGNYRPQDDDTYEVLDEDTGVASVKNAAGEVRATLQDWVTDEQGRIESYSDANGTPIGDRLWTKEPTGQAYGTKVEVLSAFRTSSGNMIINVAVQSDAEYVDFEPAYVGPDGIARGPLSNLGSDEIVAGATTLASYVYEQAGFGGKFVYEAYDRNGWETADIILVIE